MKKKVSITAILSFALLILGVSTTSFTSPVKNSPHPVKALLKNGKIMVKDGCKYVTYGYYTVTGGSSNPNTHYTWDDASGSFGISGLDPRTVQLFPSFGGGGTYTFTKLSSNPSNFTLYGAGSGSSCYVIFNTWGQVITIQVTKGSESHVVSFYFTS